MSIIYVAITRAMKRLIIPTYMRYLNGGQPYAALHVEPIQEDLELNEFEKELDEYADQLVEEVSDDTVPF